MNDYDDQIWNSINKQLKTTNTDNSESNLVKLEYFVVNLKNALNPTNINHKRNNLIQFLYDFSKSDATILQNEVFQAVI